jgi:hypothetical protein
LGQRLCCSLILKELENTSQALEARGKTHQLSLLTLENRFLAVLTRREMGSQQTAQLEKESSPKLLP